MANPTDVVVLAGARTPIGSFLGELSSLPAPHLGGVAIKAAVARAGVEPASVDECIMGCVLQAGVGQAPARQAAHHGGLLAATPAVTVNKVCGSGLKAVIQAAQAIASGDGRVVVAGGMESMSQAPYLLPRAREGFRMGHVQALDAMIHDGLWDAYSHQHMGDCAEICARDKAISRADQDAYAAESFRRAREAQQAGKFHGEIVPVEIPQRKGPSKLISVDEGPGRGDPSKFPSLRPAFGGGTITAGNASSLADGAAALVLAGSQEAAQRGWVAQARIVGWAGFAQDPVWFTTAPAGAIGALLKKIGWSVNDVDLWEINEAFAVVALVNNQLLGLDPARVNIWGGAVAVGHPIGASGARLLVTLLAALADQKKRRGVAALCIGGGEGIALAVERI